jgi:hypothetical protein
MITRGEFQDLAHLRLKEAEALFGAGLHEGAMYLGGHAVVFGLKACICRLLGVEAYPDIGRFRPAYVVHDLEHLLLLSGLDTSLHSEVEVQANWTTVVGWTPERRYRITGTSEGQTREFLDAIRDPTNGVLAWMKKHW